MATKISKEELSKIIIRIKKQADIDDVRTEIDDIADEYNLDLDEHEELDDDRVIDEIDEEFIDSDYYNDNNEDDDWN